MLIVILIALAVFGVSILIWRAYKGTERIEERVSPETHQAEAIPHEWKQELEDLKRPRGEPPTAAEPLPEHDCPTCGEAFNSAADLAAHQSKFHPA